MLNPDSIAERTEPVRLRLSSYYEGGYALNRRQIWLLAAGLSLVLLLAAPSARADQVRIQPSYPVPSYVTQVLDIAAGEIGYREGDHGYTKYGEWSGDPYAQWCAEFLCWCVDQVDQRDGTELLGTVFPRYSGQNTGRSWFIRNGRYVVRNGNLDGWGYQWLYGEDHFLTPGEYIPEPSDWVFFTWTDTQDTDHVAMVEYCTRDTETGSVTIHCIEGNTPVAVKRAEYDLTYNRILGFGTVHDTAEWTIRSGNSGFKVRELQEKLVRLGLMTPDQVDGICGSSTILAVRAWQSSHGLKQTGIANLETQRSMDRRLAREADADFSAWIVEDSDPADALALDNVPSLSDLMRRYGQRSGEGDLELN